jgi:hypothetical protein
LFEKDFLAGLENASSVVLRVLSNLRSAFVGSFGGEYAAECGTLPHYLSTAKCPSSTIPTPGLLGSLDRR